MKIAVGVRPPRGYRGRGVAPPNRQSQTDSPFIPERNIIDNMKSENSSLENFPFHVVYYVVRPAKQKKDNNLVV